MKTKTNCNLQKFLCNIRNIAITHSKIIRMIALSSKGKWTSWAYQHDQASKHILGKRTLPIAVIKNSNKREQFLSPHENYMKRNYEANAYDIISDQIFNIYVCRLKYLTNRYRCGITNKHATDHKKRKWNTSMRQIKNEYHERANLIFKSANYISYNSYHCVLQEVLLKHNYDINELEMIKNIQYAKLILHADD